MRLDGLFPKAPKAQDFSKDGILKAVAELVVCDDQSLTLPGKALFRNCLVAMRPTTIKSDLPSQHDVSNYIHNSFVLFLRELKANIQVILLTDISYFVSLHLH
ncbi:hypothetical protein BU15DRAFT_54617 [Melanogaster broomeanus]|nr:hypothetical protein BU15DRAFT_54617 [Melanogaster broomeanus]